MGVSTFAAIDVGSYELCMKIYEISKKNGIRQIDHVRHTIDMGTETYSTGKLSFERVHELCEILQEFSKIMKSYGVVDYKAYGTSAIRESKNQKILLDQIEQRTGIRIEVMSNSEQRFLDYKSLAFQDEQFQKIIENPTAILDIGGGSIQISLFDKDTLVSTQNIKIGVLRMQDHMNTLNASLRQYPNLVEEIVEAMMVVYKKLYVKDRTYKNIIIVDDYISSIVVRNHKNIGAVNRTIEATKLREYLELMNVKSMGEVSKLLDVPEEDMPKLLISMLMVDMIVKDLGGELLWVPGVTLCDGIAYEYAEKNKLISSPHDFEKDIIACAKSISKRYQGSKKRSETLENITLTIFDSMKKIHGLGKRERLLLQLAASLHDCGKYVSMMNLGECSYSIIMATEIIGLSHVEREIVANVVKYNHTEFEYFDAMEKDSAMDLEAYLKVAKLCAILRIANGLDRSHKQKFKNFKVQVKDDELVITVETDEDITLEKGLFGNRAEFFSEVYKLKPIIRQKRSF